jgi:hypothetical protein
MGARISPRRVWIAVLAGLLWGHASIALSNLVIARYLVYGDGVAAGGPYRFASWTLLLPLTLASRAGLGDLATMLLCPALAVALLLAAATQLGGSRRFVRLIAASLAVAAAVSSVCVAGQFRDNVAAEREFLALIGRSATPHRDPGVVAEAQVFARHHPDSRWCGEALRVVAMAAWDRGDVAQADELWARFEARFRDERAPGVAYAEYSRALCDEQLGRVAGAEAHLRAAVAIIRGRRDGIQSWIAVDAAKRLAGLERSKGRLALADYWSERSAAFENAASIE